ncbi:energy transducer TonB [Piscinibacter sp.]|uniref:energy transducer TonB n=1 Tax=Piscinibacter sp. TaxID=1903157 RepID=UPI002BD60109|nr:energy transducer TonB [Albitalea sp.]HUG25232.1 energy transducer TonB [Albitalea sp.]
MGVGTVALLHLVVVYALLTGLAKKVVDIVKPPVETKVIEEVKKLPPPPEIPIAPPPQLEAPPPPFIPPPEVQISAPPPPPQATVSATTNSAPPTVDLPPTPAPAAPARPEIVSISVACPRMVAPRMPARAVNDGINGSITARATIRGAKVVAVDILKSQPRGVFDAAVRTAMLQYQCQATGDQKVQAVQDFTFRND